MSTKGLIRNILLLILLGALLTVFLIQGSWGINKTVNWAWDLTNVAIMVPMISIPLYVIGYGLVLIRRKKWSFKLVIIQLGLVIASILWFSFLDPGYGISMLLMLLGFVLFVYIMWKTFRKKNTKPLNDDGY